MSSVRMCDTCSTVFSEREEGWVTGQFTQQVRDVNGNPRTETVQIDACAGCNPAANQSVRPMIASIPTNTLNQED